MTESRETFETYPYQAGATGPTQPQDPPPAGLQPRVAVPPQTPPPSPPKPSGVGRRVVLGLAAAVGAAVVAGVVVNRTPTPASDAEPSMVEMEPADDEPIDDEPINEPSYASLSLGDGDAIGVEVPADWQVDSQDDYLVISHPAGRLVARIPEWSRATRNDLASEVDYLRDGFDPSGEPTVFDNSTSRLTQLNQITSGHFAGEPATEEVMLLLEPEMQQAIAIWWATVDTNKQAAVEARTMVADLRAGFLER